jgi:hypothetical protein
LTLCGGVVVSGRTARRDLRRSLADARGAHRLVIGRSTALEWRTITRCNCSPVSGRTGGGMSARLIMDSAAVSPVDPRGRTPGRPDSQLPQGRNDARVRPSCSRASLQAKCPLAVGPSRRCAGTTWRTRKRTLGEVECRTHRRPAGPLP